MMSFLIPDRLPSIIVLVGFWIPPAIAGWLAGEFLQRTTMRYRAAVTYAVLTIFVLGYAAAWFFFNLNAIPPYLPGATQDPKFAPPEAVKGLAVVTCALILPGSAIACLLAFRIARRLRRTFAARVSA
ncbi:MAG TPA: hypothetical protein VFX97_01235 [Pyrinomonadaceae bacterium]|nr:hypothetical protein [Pyrinomonadaceae bacterium]